MTYQQVIDTIKNAAVAVNQAGFYLNAAGKSNTQRMADVAALTGRPMPYIALLFLKARPDLSQDMISWECAMMFLKQDQPDSPMSGADDHSNGVIPPVEDLVSEMYDLCEAFLGQLDDTRELQLSNIQGTPEIRTTAKTLSGWGCSFYINSRIKC